MASVEQSLVESGAERISNRVSHELAVLLRQAAIVRASSDPDAIHDLRVASRRLRAGVALFAPILPRKRQNKAEKSLRKVTKALGTPREWDVHAEQLRQVYRAAEDALERAAIEVMLDSVDARREELRIVLFEKLDALSFEAVRSAVDAVLVPIAACEEESLRAFAGPLLRETATLAFDGLEELQAVEQPEALHEMRIRVKKLRYTLEFLEPLFRNGSASDLRKRAKSLQDALGLHHDRFVLAALVEKRRNDLSARGRVTLTQGLAQVVDRLQRGQRECYETFRKESTDWPLDRWLSELDDRF